MPESLLYVATPANFAVNSTTDVTIVTTDVTGIVAGDQLVVEAQGQILINGSGNDPSITFTTDFDAAFDVEHTTGLMSNSATQERPWFIRAVLDVRSASLAYGQFVTEYFLVQGALSGLDTTMLATNIRAEGWGTTASDLTGTVTVVLKMRSTEIDATQTCRLHSLTIRRVYQDAGAGVVGPLLAGHLVKRGILQGRLVR